MKKIGLDISLQASRDEGYLTMEYEPRDFKENPKSANCTFKATLPYFIRAELGWLFNGYNITIMSAYRNWDDLYETYLEQRDTDTIEHENLPNPRPLDVLQLAETVNQLGYLDTQGLMLDQLKYENELKDKAWAKARKERKK